MKESGSKFRSLPSVIQLFSFIRLFKLFLMLLEKLIKIPHIGKLAPSPFLQLPGIQIVNFGVQSPQQKRRMGGNDKLTP